MTKRYIINKGAEGDVSAQLNGLASLILFAIAATDRGESFMSEALATSGFFKEQQRNEQQQLLHCRKGIQEAEMQFLFTGESL